MVIDVYAIHDSCLGYSMPILRDNDAVATRAFEYDVVQENSPYSLHPEHFKLFHIGTYNTDDGSIVSCEPRYICSATDF